MKIMNIGIIGTGNIAKTAHAPVIINANNLKLTAVLSRSVNHGAEFIRALNCNNPCIYTDINSFVKNESIELVIICVPDGLHFKYAKACIEAGKHVLLEKPMSLEVNNCNELINLAKQKNVILAVGSHCFDMVRWISNDFKDWKTLKSITSNAIWGKESDESAIIVGKMHSKITVEIVSSVQFGPYNKLELFGSNGCAICNETFGRAGTGEIFINGEKMIFTPINPFQAQVQNVFSSIRNGGTLVANGGDGLVNVKDLLLSS